MDSYETLKNQYPSYISLDQLYVICKIAKRTARYLVTNGIIPAIDTGRKTWRYKISIDDVITYLRQRDQFGSLVPVGAVTSKKKKNYATGKRSSFAQLMMYGQEKSVVGYFDHLCSEYGDVLSVCDIADITGLHKKTLLRLLKAGHIKSMASSPRYIIPKSYLLEFVSTKRFRDIRTSSEKFIKLIEGFEAWRNQR